MLGTITNTCAIIIGTLAGTIFHSGIKEKYRDALYVALGLVSLVVGMNASLVNYQKTPYPLLFIVSIAIGSLTGTIIDIDGRFNRLVNKFSKGRDNQKNLADGLSTAILLYCIGPLSMLGPVISALQGDNTFLFTNSTLDLISSTIFASTYGFGMVLAAPVLFLWQGMFYLVASVSSSAISDELMTELLIIGGMMITASAFALLGIKNCKSLNMLPALIVPVIWFILKGLVGF